MVGLGLTSVDDPAGDTELKTTFNVFNGIATLTLKKERRIFTHLFYQTFDLDKGNNKISGRVKSLGLNISHQWHLHVAEDRKLWLGLGLGIAQDKFSDRKQLDGEGFISRFLPDRQKTAANLLLNASTTITSWHKTDLGFHTQIDLPMSGDVTRLNLFVTALF